jgi:DNA mismatch repair ATPase MutL
MAVDSPRIGLLPKDVRAKISSSCVISTAENVIEGLVTNAFDADARSVVVEADFATGLVTCVDDGIGIREEEFSEQGNLTKSHCMKSPLTATYCML